MGTNIKEKAVTKSGAAGAAQRNEAVRNDPSVASVAWTDGSFTQRTRIAALIARTLITCQSASVVLRFTVPQYGTWNSLPSALRDNGLRLKTSSAFGR